MKTLLKVTCVDNSIEPMDFVLREDFNSIVSAFIKINRDNPNSEMMIDDKFQLDIVIADNDYLENTREKFKYRHELIDLFDITNLASNLASNC